MRKNDIDNLRNLTILLLFPVHTFMIWNDFGSRFYIWVGESRLLSTLIVLVNPWFMPLLFVLSGISTRYALEKYSYKKFIGKRVQKLLIPFVCGMLLLVPVQTLYARKFFDNYTGGVLENWGYFFTHVTDFSGYDGAFTPGHLWFILFLFLICLFSLGVFRLLPYQKAVKKVEKLPAWGVLLCFVWVWLMYYLGNFGGFSLGKNLALFLLGYYVLSNEVIRNRLEKNKKWLAVLWGISFVLSVVLYARFSYYGDCWVNFTGWLSILVLLVFGRRFLNQKTRFTDYFNHASYPIYILHQTILVVLAYYVVKTIHMPTVQVLIICFGSFILTVGVYHGIRRIPVVRKGIGCL